MYDDAARANDLAAARRHSDLAATFVTKGRWNEAAARYTWAADAYRRAGHGEAAGFMERLATTYRDLIPTQYPPNVSAIVD